MQAESFKNTPPWKEEKESLGVLEYSESFLLVNFEI